MTKIFSICLAVLLAGSAVSAINPVFTVEEDGTLELQWESLLSKAEFVGLTLPNGRSVAAVEQNKLIRSLSDFSWMGATTDGGILFVSAKDGFVYGHIALKDEEWSIYSDKEGVVRIASATPLECGTLDTSTTTLKTLEKLAGFVPPESQESLDVARLLSSDKEAYEGLSNFTARTQAERDFVNLAFLNSGQPVRFEVACVRKVDFVSTGNNVDALNYLDGDTTVRQIRQDCGADLVSLDVMSGVSLGSFGPGFDNVYSIIGSASVPNITLWAHEVGHNLGLRHNVENDPDGGPEHGYWWCGPGNTWCNKDIMAYGTSCPTVCPAVALYSNPNVTHQGVSAGMTGVAEAALVATLNAQEIAGYMPKMTQGQCTADTDTMCLLGGRFSVEVGWQTNNLSTGVGRVSDGVADTNQSGRFWFFQEANVELIVKMVDACSFNQNFWVFLAGLTNVGVTVVITDNETGVSKFYYNDLSQAFGPQQDTEAFPCDG